MPYLGECASVFTSVLYSGTAILFGRAGERVGSATVNAVRLGSALVVMVVLHLALNGAWFPVQAGTSRFVLLGFSGLIGFSLGDALLFEAYLLLGPRLAVLVYTLWPVFAALMAWVGMGEAMGLGKAFGMLVTLGGVALVVSVRNPAPVTGRAGSRRHALGVLLAVGASAGQAIGFVLAKLGMTGGFSPVSANLIRVAAGSLALWSWQALRGQLGANLGRLRDTRAATLIGLGSLFGPVAGVVLGLYAVNHARYLGVASTLMSLSPVMMLPYAWLVDKERISVRATVGTLVTVAGTGAMFLF